MICNVLRPSRRANTTTVAFHKMDRWMEHYVYERSVLEFPHGQGKVDETVKRWGLEQGDEAQGLLRKIHLGLME